MLPLLATLVSAAPNLVLITMDTTRADALSCDGQVPGLLTPREDVTPRLCALADQGVRFTDFHSHAPTTLNSHASLFTGLDPHGHAVPRNGFPLPDGIPTLATRLAAQGYDTVAVVGARALEADMGLSAGFRLYDDTMSVRMGPMHQDRAEGVVARSLAAVDTHPSDRPLFLWVHFYDPHGPYRAPGAWFDRFADPAYDGPLADPSATVNTLRRELRRGRAAPADVDQAAARYLGEVAYMDHHIGVLLDALDERDLLDEAVIVATADHGETLSEDPAHAWSHGMTVDDGVTRVPLILVGRGVPIARGAVVERTAGMHSLAPTLEALLGLEPTLGTGLPLDRWVRPGPVRDDDGWPERPTRTVFAEATRPFKTRGPTWNNLGLHRSVRVGRVGLVRDGAVDRPFGIAERAGTIARDRLTAILVDLLERWDSTAPPFRSEEMDAETLDALRALGYIDGPQGTTADTKPVDPP